MPLMTVRAVEAYRPKAEPYKITLDRGLQLRIAPDGKRTPLVRHTVKGSTTERQYRLPRSTATPLDGSSSLPPARKPGASVPWPDKGPIGQWPRTPGSRPRLRLALQLSSAGPGRPWRRSLVTTSRRSAVPRTGQH